LAREIVALAAVANRFSNRGCALEQASEPQPQALKRNSSHSPKRADESALFHVFFSNLVEQAILPMRSDLCVLMFALRVG
jgi:hypothetical protein